MLNHNLSKGSGLYVAFALWTATVSFYNNCLAYEFSLFFCERKLDYHLSNLTVYISDALQKKIQDYYVFQDKRVSMLVLLFFYLVFLVHVSFITQPCC